MYSTQKLIKSTKRDNSVPTILLNLSSVSLVLLKNLRTTLVIFYILFYLLLVGVLRNRLLTNLIGIIMTA